MTDDPSIGSTRVAIVGAGYMGGGIGQVLALSGSVVTLGDVDAERAALARERLIGQAQDFEQRGLFEAGSADLLADRLVAADSIEDAVAEADYITEAVFEKRDTKKTALARISAAAPATAVIGTNTSAIPIGELAEAVQQPQRFLGVHWMNPAPFVPGVELIPHEGTDPSAVELAESIVKAGGKVPARVSDSPGFVANRLQFALYKEAVLMVQEGLATPQNIDTVVSNTFGFRLALFGPFAIGDMAGLDVYASSYESLAAEYGDRLAAPELLTQTVQRGDLGLKSGHGFLDIDADKVEALVAYRDAAYRALSELRRKLGDAPGL